MDRTDYLLRWKVSEKDPGETPHLNSLTPCHAITCQSPLFLVTSKDLSFFANQNVAFLGERAVFWRQCRPCRFSGISHDPSQARFARWLISRDFAHRLCPCHNPWEPALRLRAINALQFLKEKSGFYCKSSPHETPEICQYEGLASWFCLKVSINSSKQHSDITPGHSFSRIWQWNDVMLICQSIFNVIIKDRWTTLFCTVHLPS